MGKITKVYVEYGSENEPGGANLMKAADDSFLAVSTDRRLIEASVGCTDGPAQGVVFAYFGIDGHWHFHRHLSDREAMS